jgi:hypothetical protein
MSKQTGQHESRILKGGEIIYLLKEPGRNWTISSYEFHQKVGYDVIAGGLMFEIKQGLPKEWQKYEFNTVDDAVIFVQEEIDSCRVSSNKQIAK